MANTLFSSMLQQGYVDPVKEKVAEKATKLQEKKLQLTAQPIKANILGYYDADTPVLDSGIGKLRESPTSDVWYDAAEMYHGDNKLGEGKSPYSMELQRKQAAQQYGIPVEKITDDHINNLGANALVQKLYLDTLQKGEEPTWQAPLIDPTAYGRAELDLTPETYKQAGAEDAFGQSIVQASGIDKYGRVLGSTTNPNTMMNTTDAMALNTSINSRLQNSKQAEKAMRSDALRSIQANGGVDLRASIEDKSYWEQLKDLPQAIAAGIGKSGYDAADMYTELGGDVAGRAVGLVDKDLGKSIDKKVDLGTDDEKTKRINEAVGYDNRFTQQNMKKVKEDWDKALEKFDILSPSTWLDIAPDKLYSAAKTAFKNLETAGYSLGYMMPALAGAVGKIGGKLVGGAVKAHMDTATETLLQVSKGNLKKEAAENITKESLQKLSKTDRTKLFLVNNADALQYGAMMNNNQLDEYIKNNGGEDATVLRSILGTAFNAAGMKLDVGVTKSILQVKPGKELADIVGGFLKGAGENKARIVFGKVTEFGIRAAAAGLSEAPQEYIQTFIEEFNTIYGTKKTDGSRVGLEEATRTAGQEAGVGALAGTAGGVFTSVGGQTVKGTKDAISGTAQAVSAKKQEANLTPEYKETKRAENDKAVAEAIDGGLSKKTLDVLNEKILEAEANGDTTKVKEYKAQKDTVVRSIQVSEIQADNVEILGSEQAAVDYIHELLSGIEAKDLDNETVRKNIDTIAKKNNLAKDTVNKIYKDQQAVVGGISGGEMATAATAVGTVKDAITSLGKPKKDSTLPTATELEAKVKEELAISTKEINSKVAKVTQPREVTADTTTTEKVTSKETESSLVDKFNQLEVLKTEAEKLGDADTVQKILYEEGAIADKLMEQAEQGKVGTDRDALDAIETLVRSNDKVSDKKLVEIAAKAGIAAPEAAVAAVKTNIAKSRDDVEQDVTVGPNGYKTIGRNLRSLSKDSTLFKNEIAMLKDKMSNLRTTQKKRKATLEKYVKDIESKLQLGDKYLGIIRKQITIPREEYKSVNNEKFVIHRKHVENKLAGKTEKEGVYQTIADINRTLVGINKELRDSNIVLDSDTLTRPANAKKRKDNKGADPESVYQKANKLVAYVAQNNDKPSKVYEKADRWRKANKSALNSNKFIEADIVAIIPPNVPWKKENVKVALGKTANEEGKTLNTPFANIGRKIEAITKAGASIVIDVDRRKNNAEQAIADMLESMGYVEVDSNTTIKKNGGKFVPASKAKQKKAKAETEATETTEKPEAKPTTVQIPLVEEAGTVSAKTELTPEQTVDVIVDVLATSVTAGKKPVSSYNVEQEVDINKIVQKTGTVKNIFVQTDVNNLVAQLQDYMMLASNKIYGIITDVNTASPFKESLMQYDSLSRGLLFKKDEQGNHYLNGSVIATVALAADEFIATSSRLITPKTKEDVARLLGVTEMEVSREMLEFFKNHGAFKKTIANNIGKTAMDNLGLKINDNIDTDTYDKLVADLGNVGVLYLESKKDITVDYEVDAKTYAAVINDGYNTYSKASTVHFVTIPSNKRKDIVDKAKEVVDTIGELAGIEISMEKGPLDKPAPIREKEIARRGIATEVSETSTEALNKLRNVEYTTVKYGINWLKKTDKDGKYVNRARAMELMGYVKPDDMANLSFKEQESKEAQNEQIEKSIDDLINNDMESMYFDWFFTGNGRFILDSNSINPQTNKLLHRFLVVPKEAFKKVNLNNPDSKVAFYDAIAQASGFAIDKKHSSKAKKQAETILRILPEYLEAALNSKERLATINKFMVKNGASEIEIEHLGHYLQMIDAVRAYREANGKPFTTSIAAEYDGITSGFAIRLMQMPILKDMYTWLNKVGVFQSKSNSSDPMTDRLADGLIDSYKTLGSKIDPSNMAGPKDKYFKDQYKLWEVIKTKLPQMEDGVVSSELRSLFKGPFMTFNYAAGLATIKKSLGYAIVDDIVNQMAQDGDDINGKYFVLYTKLSKQYKASGGEGTFQLALRTKDYDFIKLDKKGKTNVGTELRTTIEKTYGKAVEVALTDEFGAFVAANNTINNSFRAMFSVFKVKYDEEIAQAKKDGVVLTKSKKDEIVVKLIDSMPIIEGPNSQKGVHDGIVIIGDTKATSAPKGGAAKTHIKNGSINKKKGTKIETRTVQAIRKQLDAAINAGSVIPIHFIDGAVMADLINRFSGQGQFIHDAIIMPNDTSMDAIRTYNKSWGEKGASYDMVEKIALAMDRVYNSIEDKSKIPDLTVFLKEGEHMIGKEQTFPPGEYNIAFTDIQAMMDALAKKVTDGRNKLFSEELDIMQLVGPKGTGYKLKAKEAKLSTRTVRDIKPKLTNKEKEAEQVGRRQEAETQRDLENIEIIANTDASGSSADTMGDYVDAIYEESYDKVNRVLNNSMGMTLMARFNGGNKVELQPITKTRIDSKKRSITFFTENAQWTFYEGSTNSEKTANGTYIQDERMAEATNYIFSILDQTGITGTSKETQKHVKKKAGFVKLRKEVHRNISAMKKLATNLEELSHTKASDKHKEHLLSLFDKINPKFLTNMTTYLNTAAEKTGGIVDYKAKEIMIAISKTDMQAEMGGMETYTHEVMHSYLGYAFRNEHPEAKKLMGKLLRLRREASKIITVNDLIPEQVLDSKEAKKKAQAQWDYMFNNKEGMGLEEFVALGLTNEKIKAILENSSTMTEQKQRSLFRAILDAAIKVLDLITGMDIDTRSKSIYDNILQLSFELAQYNNKALKKVQPRGSFLTSLDNAKFVANKKASEALKSLSAKMSDYELTSSPRNGSKLDYGLWLAKALPKLILDNRYKPQLKTVLASLGASPTGFLQNIIKDVSTPDATERVVERLGLMADRIDSVREDIKSAARTGILESFKKKPTNTELNAITLGLLDTDISSLVGNYSMAAVRKILDNDVELQDKISTVTTRIRKADKTNFNWLLTQAKGLGRYMATHKANLAQNYNAENIVKQFSTNNRQFTADKDLVAMVDELATLYAVKYTPKETRDIASAMIAKEPLAIKTVLNTHIAVKEEAAKKLFSTSKAHIIKGYTRAINDDSIELSIKPLSARADMENEGFKLIDVVKKDTNDRSGVAMGIYQSKSFTNLPYNRAATRLTDTHRRGTTLTEAYFNAGATMADAQAKADIKAIDRERAKVVKAMREGTFDVDKGNQLSPVLNPHGKVIDYRYTMGKARKRELLQQEIAAHKILANMIGNNYDKPETDKHNENVLRVILDDMKKFYVDGEVIGKNGERYVAIEKDSTNERIAEIYNILPENVKTAIANSDKKHIAVREDLLSMYFGFRDPSIFNTNIAKKVLPKELRMVGRVAGKIWEDIVSISKVDIVIRTPMVLIENIMSNFMWSYASGTNIFKTAKLQLESSKEVVDYVAKNRELNKLKFAKKSGNLSKREIGRIGMLEEELKANAAHVLISDGMYQSIIEDVDKKDLEARSTLLKKFSWVTDNTPEWVKQGADMLYITSATKPFQFIVKATQYSDLVARITQYKILTERGMTSRRAKDIVLDVIINYNKPSSSFEEWANNMGLAMFTKYFKRVQRAINIGIREHPVTFLTNILMQETLIGDLPGVEDSNFIIKNYGAMLFSPMEMIEDHLGRALNPTSLEILQGEVKLF